MDFYGCDLTEDDCELFTLANIHHLHLGDEAKAMQNKWFDYRLWPSLKASYYFAHCYEKAYRNFFAQTRDLETSKRIPVFNTPNPMLSRQATNIHLARQAFDILGVRYEFGIKFAMDRFCQRGWQAMPRTNQLYSEELLTDMQEAWVKECRAKLQLPSSPYFLAENYEDSLIQNQFHQWLLTEINKRVHKYMTVGQVVYVQKVLPEAVAISMFGEELVARGKKDAIT